MTQETGGQDWVSVTAVASVVCAVYVLSRGSANGRANAKEKSKNRMTFPKCHGWLGAERGGKLPGLLVSGPSYPL